MHLPLILRLGASLLCLAGAAPALAQNAAPAAGEIIEKLLSLPHGLAKLSPQDAALLATVTNAPQRFLPLLGDLAAAMPPGVATEPESRLRYERLMLLLSRFDHPDATRILGEAYRQASRRMQPGAAPRSELEDRFLISTRRLIIDLLRQMEDASLVTEALTTLEADDHATQLVWMRYLADVARSDPHVKSALTDMLHRPTSSLHNDPVLKRTLHAIE
jgi:hypothetical protein